MNRDFSSMSAAELSSEFLLWGHTVLFYRRRLSRLESAAVETREAGRDITVEHATSMGRALTRLRQAERKIALINEAKAKLATKAAA